VKFANFDFVTLYKEEFLVMDFLYWILNVEIHLDAMGLSDTIKEINKASKQ